MPGPGPEPESAHTEGRPWQQQPSSNHPPPWSDGRLLQLSSRWGAPVFARHFGRVGRVLVCGTPCGPGPLVVRLEWPDGPERCSKPIHNAALMSQPDDQSEWLARSACREGLLPWQNSLAQAHADTTARVAGDATIAAAKKAQVEGSSEDVVTDAPCEGVPPEELSHVGRHANDPDGWQGTVAQGHLSSLILTDALQHDDGDAVFIWVLRDPSFLRCTTDVVLSTTQQHLKRQKPGAAPRVTRAVSEIERLGAVVARRQLLSFSRMALGVAGWHTAAQDTELPSDVVQIIGDFLPSAAAVPVLHRMGTLQPYLRGGGEHLVSSRVI